MSVSVLIKKSTSTVGEGPHWDPISKSLFYVDIISGDVHKYDSTTGEDTKVHFGKYMLRTNGHLSICKSKEIWYIGSVTSEHSHVSLVPYCRNFIIPCSER